MAENHLADTLKSIKKQYGSGAIMSMSEHRSAETIELISTGNTAVDALTGVGGLPRGRIIEIFGPEGGGKTTLCLQAVAQAQKLGGIVAYIDSEHSLDCDYARALGVDVDSLLISQPDFGEMALEIALMLARSGGVMLIVIDSVAALVPQNELLGEIGDAQMGSQARMMSQAMRMIVGAAAQSNTALIFINQVRDKLGITFGNSETTAGGRALKFYSSLRIDLRRISQIKKGDQIIGQNVKIKTIKNKLAAPYRSAEVKLLYGQGFVNE